MKTTLTTLLGSLLACALCTTALAKPSNVEPPGLERRVWQLEQMMQTLQKRVEALEELLDQTAPVCPCFDEEEIKALTLESCEVTANGAIKGTGPQASVAVGNDSCAIRTPDGSVNLSITPQEQWACVQPLLNTMANQSVRCPANHSNSSNNSNSQ
jgi:hypothetical protein